MLSSMTEKAPPLEESRAARLKRAVQGAAPGVCIDRAILWTQYHKDKQNKGKPVIIQMAEALSHVLRNKRIAIYPDELLVGNFSSKRVGGSIYPELHGVTVMEDIFAFSRRQTNPLQITPGEILKLLGTVPHWAFRFLGFKVYGPLHKKLAFIYSQTQTHFYLINELGGVAHLAPDYGKLITTGMDGYTEEIEQAQQNLETGSPAWLTLEAMKIIAQGVVGFGTRYGALARGMAQEESDPQRKAELSDIARVCEAVPARPAATFQEALQSVLFIQIAITLESLDNGICPGRMDQYLYPLYQADLEAGRIDRQRAKELLASFCIKLSELIPVFSRRINRFHGGMFNGQVVTVGGADRDGDSAVNELSFLLLEVIDELRIRQPNFHARVNPKDPDEYTKRIYSVLAGGGNTPALYNDPVIQAALERAGYSPRDARNYTGVGCVEPVCQGKSFSSTDAAIVNLPILLELALNQGRRFGGRRRVGAQTPPPAGMKSMADVTDALEAQLAHRLGLLIEDLQAVEKANREHHPTPLSSLLLDGCLESATCSTAGGAAYNFSGIQCVGPSDTGDALYAIEQAVFAQGRLSLEELTAQLEGNLADEQLLVYLKNLPKFGNDQEAVDRWTRYVVTAFRTELERYENTRGGRYTTGLYSVTAHQFFGSITGALPHGRRKGESFASGLAPGNGMDRNGPTALINSMNRFDFADLANGINFNIKFDSLSLRGATGVAALASLMKTYFRRGGMQAQVNVLDPEMLIQARDDPTLHPNLLVRVSGYSAYFNDLTMEMKDELIRRTSLTAVGGQGK
jgi:pyruvate formate-lyase/glycerol dehydratase family glycyl radical enzyme